MEATTSLVSLSDLKRLLFSIAQQQAHVSIRYRTLGQLWYPNFLTVVKLEQGKSVLFHDEIRRKLISLPDISRIMQFELDGKCYPFEPNCHYQVSDDE
jgi:hypothetical protein